MSYYISVKPYKCNKPKQKSNKTKQKSKKMKGGVNLNDNFPRRDGETVNEYVDRIEGQSLPRYRTQLPMRNTIERGRTRNETHQSYLNRLKRRFRDIIRESPVEEEKPNEPDIPTPPPRLSRRPRKNTKSAPTKNKSKKSGMKLAVKGSYKRRRGSAPTKKKMSTKKAKDFVNMIKRRQNKFSGG